MLLPLKYSIHLFIHIGTYFLSVGVVFFGFGGLFSGFCMFKNRLSVVKEGKRN